MLERNPSPRPPTLPGARAGMAGPDDHGGSRASTACGSRATKSHPEVASDYAFNGRTRPFRGIRCSNGPMIAPTSSG